LVPALVTGIKPDIPENIQPYRVVLLKTTLIGQEACTNQMRPSTRSPIGSIQKNHAWLPTIGQTTKQCLRVRD